jgi:hypothetical protein
MAHDSATQKKVKDSKEDGLITPDLLINKNQRLVKWDQMDRSFIDVANLSRNWQNLCRTDASEATLQASAFCISIRRGLALALHEIGLERTHAGKRMLLPWGGGGGREGQGGRGGESRKGYEPALVTIGAAAPDPVPARPSEAAHTWVVPQLPLPAALADPLPKVADDAQLLLWRIRYTPLRLVLHILHFWWVERGCLYIRIDKCL